MTNVNFFSKTVYRCDSCGGTGQGCCDDPHVVDVHTFDAEKLAAHGIHREDGNGQDFYTLPDGTVLGIDHNGWGCSVSRP